MQKRHYSDWHAGLAEEEKSAVGRYIGMDYKGMNGVLRDPAHADSYEAAYRGSKQSAANLSSALSKASVPEDVVAYRGVQHAAKRFGELKIGASYRDSGFMSLSQDHRVALGFMNSGEGEAAGGRLGAVIRVTVPKGSKVGAVSMHEKNVKTSEHELIAAPGHGLKITKITKKSGRMYIDATLLSPQK